MASNEQPTAAASQPEDPSRTLSETPQQHSHVDLHAGPSQNLNTNGGTFITNALHTSSANYYGGQSSGLVSVSSNSTAVPSPDTVDNRVLEPQEEALKTKEEERKEEVVPELVHGDSSSDSGQDEPSEYAAIKSTPSATRPSLKSRQSQPLTEEDLFRALSRRRTSQTNGLGRSNTQATASSADDEQDEINRLMSRMFGHTRQEASEEEKTRHVGVVFKNLTVKGQGLGAALQPSVGDFFLNPVRLVKNLVTRGPKAAAGKPPVRTLIDDFSGCIKPGRCSLYWGGQVAVAVRFSR